MAALVIVALIGRPIAALIVLVMGSMGRSATVEHHWPKQPDHASDPPQTGLGLGLGRRRETRARGMAPRTEVRQQLNITTGTGTRD